MKVKISFLGLVFIFMCSLLLSSNVIAQQDVNDYIIFQNGVEKTVPVYNGVIEIERDAFSIRFYNKKYNQEKNETYDVKVVGFLKPKEWEKIESGLKIEQSNFFKGGSAYAYTQDGTYNGFFFSDVDDFIGGSHHLVYGHPEVDPLTVLKKEGEYFKFEFKVEYLFLKEKLVKISDTELSEFYIIFLNDKNLDGIADEDELTKVVIKFKK